MSENPKEEKLSFKEQILRDLERVKKQDRSEQENEITSFETPSSPEDSVVPSTQDHEPSAEELMANSLSVVDQILKNAPSVPSRSMIFRMKLQQMKKLQNLKLKRLLSL